MSERINDGGPAFPHHVYRYDGASVHSVYDGMSLRDWFAGMAMQGFLASNPVPISQDRNVVLKAMGETSYAVADALLAERSKKP